MPGGPYSWRVASTVALTLVTLLLVALVAAGGIGVTWWAIFGDKSRGRRRCPRCWHDLSGTPGLTCGECGHAARDERDLHAARRRWSIAAVTVAFMVGVAGWARLEVLDAKWHTHLPDGALALVVRTLDPGSVPDWAWAELDARASMDALGADAAIDALGALVQPGEGIPPWEPRARLVESLASTEPEELDDDSAADPQAQAARASARTAFLARRDAIVASVPVHVTVRVPAAWPADEDPAALAWGWLPGRGAQWRVRVEGDREWIAAEGGRPRRAPDRTTALRMPRPGPDGRVQARVEAQWRRGAEDGAWSPSTWIEVDAPVRALAEGLPVPIDDAALDAAAREAFALPVTAWQDDLRPVTFTFDPRPDFPLPDGIDRVLVGVLVELVERGTVRRTVAFWWQPGADRRGSEVLVEDLDALRRLRELASVDTQGPVEGWSLRIRGDRRTALLATGIDRPPQETHGFWSGSLEAPAVVRRERSPAPRRPTWRIPAAAGD